MKKILYLFVISFCIISCSTEENQIAYTIDESVPVISDLVSFVPDTKFDKTSKGKYIGMFGHHSNPKLHGKVYVNAANDTRYAIQINLTNGEILKFQGLPRSSYTDKVFFQGESGSFEVDFSNYLAPEVSNVFIKEEPTQAYIILAKSTESSSPFVFLGTYVDSSDPSFNGNWNLMTDATSSTNTPFNFGGISGTVESQEINQLVVTRTGITTPFKVTTFDTNTAAACAPAGITLPTNQPVILDLSVPFVGDIGDAISAGGQTSLISNFSTTWSLNFANVVSQGINYANDDCTPAINGTWARNGRSGTVTVNATPL